jgi:outer membrane protein OmpA-like peptidoglycan-associated protein
MRQIPRISLWLVPAVLILMSAAAFGQEDKPGSKDYPGITRMPNFYIYLYDDKQFDSADFPIKVNGADKQETVEGHFIHIQYQIKDNVPATSALQIVRNHQNAVRAIGGQVLREDHGDNWRNCTLRVTKSGKEVWILLESRDSYYDLTIVEKQAMQQDLTANADAMNRDLAETGKVAVYGIYFDTGKSELKPESDPALAEIGKLLKQNPALKVFIVGHTDMVGDPTANVKLSQARAQSVVAALVSKQGIAAARLTPFGAGPYAPVASNRTEEGRAKNRRVELVEIATK